MKFPDKIKKEIRLELEAMEGYSFDSTLFVDETLLGKICLLSQKTGYEIALVIDRKGRLTDIIMGNKNSAQIDVTKSDGKLNGYRVIHTHPSGDSTLSAMDLSMLKNNAFDCVAAVAVKDGEAYNLQAGYFDGKDISVVNVHDARYVNKYGLIEKIQQNDKAFKEYYANMKKSNNNRAIIVKVALKNKDTVESDLEELSSLCVTAGIEVLSSLSQFRAKPDGTYFLGKGKVEDLRDIIQIYDANLVVFDNELSGSKCVNLSSILGVKVIDRSMLILDIFASRARTAEGKLQVELAQLKYSLPRLGAYLDSSGRYGGGVGMRGPGETKLELNRRIVEQNIQKKEEELKKLKKQRDISRKNRLTNAVPTVAIVGYTNSGKSTLLNLLARSNVYVKDELFATLDTTTRKVWFANKKEVLFIDTVGFINNLPHEFIEAFSSTLEESIYADLILHVVDAANPESAKHIDVTNKVLAGMNCKSPVIMVYNKCDKVSIKDRQKNIVYISAKTGEGIAELKEIVADKLLVDIK